MQCDQGDRIELNGRALARGRNNKKGLTMSVTSSEKRAHRTPSLLVAAIPAVTLIVLLGGGYIAASLPVEPLLMPSK